MAPCLPLRPRVAHTCSTAHQEDRPKSWEWAQGPLGWEFQIDPRNHIENQDERVLNVISHARLWHSTEDIPKRETYW